MAKSLIKVGFQQHQCMVIFGFNSPEWIISQMAAVLAGGKAAGIYLTDSPDQVFFKASHTGAAVAVVEGPAQLQPFRDFADQLPDLKAVVCWAPEERCKDSITRSDGTVVPVFSFQDFKQLGEEVSDNSLNQRISQQAPGHCCSLIYTSGTTGQPKAVMISHDNIIFESTVVLDLIPNCKEAAAERVLSYLPLSHVAGCMVDIVCPILTSARTPAWVEVSFARPYDLKLGTLGDRLRSVRPTMFLGVPRVWEKIAEKMKAVGSATTGIKRTLADWAKAKGLEYAHNCMLGGSGAVPTNYALYDTLVLSKVKEGWRSKCSP
jgi:long-chain-fatty-acid--CoA ligase ACSBG